MSGTVCGRPGGQTLSHLGGPGVGGPTSKLRGAVARAVEQTGEGRCAQTGREPHPGVHPHSQPTLTRTRAAQEPALPGGRGPQDAHPAQAHREGPRVLRRQSCSPQSGLALRGGRGRRGVLGGRGSLLGPGRGKTGSRQHLRRSDPTPTSPPRGVLLCMDMAGQQPPR